MDFAEDPPRTAQPPGGRVAPGAPAGPGSVVTYRTHDVAVVELDRPATYNALGTPLLTELKRAVADSGTEAGAIVLAAAGRHFCVGADLTEVAAAYGDPTRIGPFLTLFHEVADAIADSPVPVVAAVQGLALAGGLELALACDLIAAADSAEFGDQHINVDLIPGGGGSQRLPRAIGTRRALQLQLLGERITADQALNWGLVQAVHPAGELREQAIALARRIASRDRLAVRRIRELGRAASTMPLREGLAAELAMAVEHLSGPQLPAALRAFADKTNKRDTV